MRMTLVRVQQRKRPLRLTHHQALDILHPRLLDGLAHQNHANTGPSEEQAAETDRDEPVERRKVERATEDDVQRRSVNDEDAEARAGKDTREVIRIPYGCATEGEGEPGLDSKYLRTM